MKKTLLALAVSALSANAFAANIDYTTANPLVNTVASEVVPASNIALTTTDTVTWAAGFSITNQNLVRIDLTNGAKFTSAPTLTAGGALATISAGGVGSTYVIFQVGNVSGTSSAPIVLTFANLTAASQSDVTIGYRLYSTQPDAVAGNANTVASGNYPYVTFANGLVFNADAALTAASKQIDVAKSSKTFVNNTQVSTAFGGLNLSVKPSTYGTNVSGSALTLKNMIGAGAIVTVSGSFSAATANAGGTNLGAVAATGIDTAKSNVTFGLGTNPVALTSAGLTYATVTPTATSPVIDPSLFSAKLTLGTGAQLTAAPADVSNFANLAKNGATVKVDLALKPGGAYSNFVRISNTGSVTGNVYINVVNDAGSSASINLADVAGQTTSTLNAGSSTTQMSIQDIYDAAAAKGLTLSGEGKLRLVVDAEIPAGNLSVQTYTVSKDGNSFATF